MADSKDTPRLRSFSVPNGYTEKEVGKYLDERGRNRNPVEAVGKQDSGLVLPAQPAAPVQNVVTPQPAVTKPVVTQPAGIDTFAASDITLRNKARDAKAANMEAGAAMRNAGTAEEYRAAEEAHDKTAAAYREAQDRVKQNRRASELSSDTAPGATWQADSGDTGNRYNADREARYSNLDQNPDYAAMTAVDAKTMEKGRKAPDFSGIFGSKGTNTNLYYHVNHGQEMREHPEIYTDDDPTVKQAYDFMYDYEVRNFNYLWNTKGEDAARDYYTWLEYQLNSRRTKTINSRMQGFAEAHPVAASVASVGTNLASGAGIVSLALQNAKNIPYNIAGVDAPDFIIGSERKPIDYNTGAMLASKLTKTTRETVANKIENNTSWMVGDQNAWSFLYQTGMSMADSAVIAGLSLMGVPGATMLLGGSAATQSALEVKKRGGTDAQALAFGIVSGINEALFEEVSLDKLLKPTSRGFAAGLRNVIKQGFTEGSEEVSTTLANTIMDAVINGDLSELETNINKIIEDNPGISREEAAKYAWDNWLKGLAGDFVGGFISGLGMSGAKVVGANVAGVVSDARTAAQRTAEQTRAENAPRAEEPVARQEAEQQETERQDSTPQLELPTVGTALDNAIEKLNAGQELSGADARRIMQDTAAMQELRDSGVLNDSVRPGAEGRQQVADAVRSYAAMQSEERTTAAQRGSESAELQLTAAEQNRTMVEEGVNENEAETSRISEERRAEEGRNDEAGAEEGGQDSGGRAERRTAVADTGSVRKVQGDAAKRFVRNFVEERSYRRSAKEASGIRSAAEAAGLQKVSSADMGISGGTDTKNNAVLTRDVMTREMRKRQDEMAKRGVTVNYVIGLMETDGESGSTVLSRGVTSEDGKNIWVTANHQRLSWQHILDHESFHAEKSRDPGIVERTGEALMNDREIAPKLNEIVRRYTDLYEPLGLSDDLIMEEILADYYAGYDATELLGADKDTAKAVRSEVERQRELENRVNSEEPLSVSDEAKASREFDQKYFEAAVKYNRKTGAVDAVVLSQAQEARQQVKDWLEDPEIVKYLPADIEGDTFVADSSYGGSEELQTVCVRSLTAEGLLNAVSDALGRPMTVDETIILSQEIFALTDKPECLYCYVAMDRKAYRGFLGSYMDARDKALDAIRSGASVEDTYKEFLGTRSPTENMRYRFDLWQRIEKDGELIERKDLANLDTLNAEMDAQTGRIIDYIAEENGLNRKYLSVVAPASDAYSGPTVVYKKGNAKARTITKVSDLSSDALGFDIDRYLQINDAMRYAQGASWAKKQNSYRAYNGHILRMNQNTINKLNRMYGLRFYSFNDYSPAFILENMQMVTDASVRGLKGLAYTKETDFAEIFAPTGMAINISVFGTTSGEMVDGKSYHRVDMDGMQGADWERAKEIRRKNPNVGCTFVATSDEQVEWALDQSWIDVVIPFHMVQTGKQVADYFGWKNYTDMSRDISEISSAERKSLGLTDSIHPYQHQNDKETYLKELENAKLQPRFKKWIDHPNYMKLVNEARMRDADMKPLVPKFDLTNAKESIDQIRLWQNYYQPIFRTGEAQSDFAEEFAEHIKSGDTYDKKTRSWSSQKHSREFSPEAVAPYRGGSDSSEAPRGRKVSRVRSNALEASKFFNDVEAHMDGMRMEDYTYDPVSEKQSIATAKQRIAEDFGGWAERLARDDRQWDGQDVDTAMGILYLYRQDARMTGDYSRVIRFSHVIQRHGTRAGQEIQAFAKYSHTATYQAQKAAEKIIEENALNPAEQKKLDSIMQAVDNIIAENAGEAAEQAMNGLSADANKPDSQKTNDALNLLREIYDIFKLQQENHGEPVEDWVKLTGEELGKRIGGRLHEPKTKAQTTMQTILGDLLKFADEHALPKKKASGQTRSAFERIADYLNNREAYAKAWATAQQVLRAQYADDQAALDALDAFLTGTISYNGDPLHFDKVMLDAIMLAADGLGIDKETIRDLSAVGLSSQTIDKIARAFTSRLKREGNVEMTAEMEQYIHDTVTRHIRGILTEEGTRQEMRLGSMMDKTAKELNMKFTELLTRSKGDKKLAAAQLTNWLVSDLGLRYSDAAIAAKTVTDAFMERLSDMSDQRLQRMFAEKETRLSKEKRNKLLELFRLGGFSNRNVEDAVVDALGIGNVSREKQREILTVMAQFADTLDDIYNGDAEGIKALIRQQAALRKTKLSGLAEKALEREHDFDYLYDFAMAQLKLIAADYQKRDFGSKASTVQTISHLLNLRTAMRNVIANQVFDLVASAANNVSLIPDMIIGKVATGKRTVGLNRSWSSSAKRQGAIRGASRNLLEVALDVDPRGDDASKYGTKGRDTFSAATARGYEKFLNFEERILGYELNTTDEFHKGSVRAETLESLLRFVERGDMTIEEAREIAENEALFRSFQDDTLIGDVMRGIKNTLNVIGIGDSGKQTGRTKSKDFGLGDFIIKYTQVPGALIHRAIEFSPAGYAKAIYNLAQLRQAKKSGESTSAAQRKAALALGQATTGSGLILIMMTLAKAGLLRKDDDEKDKNAKALKNSQGLTGTQLNVTALGRAIAGGDYSLQDGDVLMDVAFLEPLDTLMTISALLAGEDDLWGSIPADTLQGIYDAISNTTAMQTISSIQQAVQYHDPENDLPLYFQIPIEIASDAVTGFVPAPVRQIAQATDTIYRDQYRSNGPILQIGAKVANTVPGVRQSLAPKLTPLGEEKRYQKPLLNALNATMNPGNISVYKTNKVIDELNSVYDATGDAKIWPERNAPYSTTISKEKITLTPDERTQYQQTRGQLTYQMADACIGTDWYKKLSAADKADCINWIGNFANYIAKSDLAESRGIDYISNTYKKYAEALKSGRSLADIVKMYAKS